MTSEALADFGWSAFFDEQLDENDIGLLPMRIANVHRARLGALADTGPIALELPPRTNTGDFAVGDWVLVEPGTNLLVRRLDRKSVLQRRTGHGIQQLAAANVDTLFIVTSCNADFNPARLERYLALANEAGTTPVIILTTADLADDPTSATVCPVPVHAPSLAATSSVLGLRITTGRSRCRALAWVT